MENKLYSQVQLILHTLPPADAVRCSAEQVRPAHCITMHDNAEQYNTAQHSTAQCGTVLYNIPQYDLVQCCTVHHSAVQGGPHSLTCLHLQERS